MIDEETFNEREFKKGLKTKRARREEEAFKVRDGVFDKATLMTLYDLIKAEKIDTVEGIVSTGKEANVFWGYLPDKTPVAIKIYRIAATSFRNMWQYLVQDPRFKQLGHHHRQVVYNWTRREYKNLMRIEDVVPVPKVYMAKNNVIVMDFLGKEGVPFPQLREVGPPHGERDLENIIRYMRSMYQQGIVHADLSEYNILVGEEKLYFIDLSQGTVLENPMAEEFLARDVENILRYFRKYIEILPTADEVLARIRGDKRE
jgi:RIO kinase 1